MLVNKDAYQRETLSKWPVRLPLISVVNILSSCTYIWGTMNLWHTDVCICVSLYLFIHSQLENASPWICLDGFLWYLETMIIRWGNNYRAFRNFGVQGNLGVIWGNCSNMLKTLLRLHNSIDFDETWVRRSLAMIGSFWLFRTFWSEVIFGSYSLNLGSN